MMRIAVVGASGYTGLESLRILHRHPSCEIVAVTSEQRAGQPVGEAFPALRGVVDLSFESADSEALSKRVDAAILCLPHATAAPIAAGLRKGGVRVVDLSADFRLSDPASYEAWYGAHGAPELFGQGVYGLPELYRDEIRGADLVAGAGCYPTSVLIPMVPFLRAGVVHTEGIHIDSKSGVSGAGRKLADTYLMAEMDGNAMAYAVASHRHGPEIEQEASIAAGSEVRVSFVPHLLPTVRGMLSTIYLRTVQPMGEDAARAVLAEAWSEEPFVRMLPAGEAPRISSVRGSNFCDVNVFADERNGTLVVLAAIDNLVKGASGQGVQCLNLMAGFEETAGLREAPLSP
ncbi:MAG: N-acetyl-gamma-glutamyl-phosphate reductase [bacterium]|nr:N-acetyl-gamma-glutamyl-phosphate reductase [bacterium]MCP5070471.1 N-acetyl-gamma-glutamyl-phosphate reductase [bacterium]